jgi:hypothetical protein
MHDSDSSLSNSDDEEIEITDDEDLKIINDIRIVRPKRGCEDEVRALFVGFGKAECAGTKAYLGFYNGEMVEQYVKAGQQYGRIFCKKANWAVTDARLTLDCSFKHFSRPALVRHIRERLGEDAGLARARFESPETVESLEESSDVGAGAGREVEARRRVGAWEQGRGPDREDITGFWQIFHLELAGIAFGAGVFCSLCLFLFCISSLLFVITAYQVSRMIERWEGKVVFNCPLGQLQPSL